MADIFVSYTSNDRNWAFWIGQELGKLGHTPHLHEWELDGGGNIAAWMEKRHDEADHILLVISKAYLTKDYSNWERQAAQWAAASNRPNFALPVYVEKCDAPTLLKPFKHCELYGLTESEAVARLATYLTPAAKPTALTPFPGIVRPSAGSPERSEAMAFPGTVEGQRASMTPLALPPNPNMIGRANRLDELVGAILGQTQPVVIPGALGMGKTALALAAAYDPRIVDRFGARRFFVSLEPTPDADSALRALAVALGCDPAGAAAAVEQAITFACAAGLTLAILDNAETPLAPKERPATEALLARLGAIPGLRLVVTVRGETPHIAGGAVALRDVEKLDETEARALFLREAGQQHAGDPALPELLGALDGHPLSLELLGACAAGKTDLRGVEADWRSRRTEMLKRGAGDNRLTSLRASVAISMAALEKGGAADRLVRLIALAPDGLSEADGLAALAADAPGDDERAAAAALETARLVSRRDGRCRLLAPIREALRLDDPPLAADKSRLLTLFLARTALGKRLGWNQWDAARDALLAEAGNLDAMIAAAVECPDFPDELGTAIEGLAKFHAFSGLASVASLPAAAERFRAAGAVLSEALCIQCLGDVGLARSDHAGARERYEAALLLYRQVGAVLGEANCIKGLGDIALQRSDHAGARERYEAALPLYRQVGDILGEANCILRLGNIALQRSDPAGARERYEAALPLYRQVGAVLGEANCIKSLGNMALAHSDHAGARERYEAALPLYRKVGAVLGEANCIQSLGDIVLQRSDPAGARERYEAALPLYRQVGAVLGEANCIKSLGDIALQRSDHAGARERYEAALPLYRQVGDVLGEAVCIARLGEIALRRSDHDGARQRYEAALPLFQKVGAVLGEANCISSLGDIDAAEKAMAAARRRWIVALALFQRISEPYSTGFTYLRLARVAATPTEATEHREAARRAWASIDRPDLIAKHLS